MCIHRVRFLLLFGMMLCLLSTGYTLRADDLTPAVKPPLPLELDVVVTARRWQEPLQLVPGSVTVVSQQTMQATGAQEVSDVEHLVPNLTLPDFSVRWLNFPFVRGIGSGRNAPAVTTMIDGVPQLSYVTANQELIAPERVEFIRGPEGSLYGRNSLAGVVNVVPSLPGEVAAASATVAAGNFAMRDIRGGASGPVGNALVGVHLGYSARNGYTINDFTGHNLDTREATFGDAQVLWPHLGAWSLRLSVTAERDHDGDYGLGDLAALRIHPWHVAQDFEGFTHRMLAQPVFTAVRAGKSTEFTSTTSLQNWTTRDLTDGDFSTFDLYRQGTNESQQAWLQEFRLASKIQDVQPHAPRWLLGALLFTDKDNPTNYTDFSAVAAAQQHVPIAFTSLHSATQCNTGASLYGQWRQPIRSRWAVTLGLRDDYEHRSANLAGFTDPALSAPTTSFPREDYNRATPQLSLDYRLSPRVFCYASMLEGYKTGGFNASAPAGQTVYNSETSTTYETGIKTSWAHNRGTANLCLFSTQWDNMQLDTPLPAFPSQFYIANAGAAHSEGAELEVNARPSTGVELFAGVGVLSSAFGAGSMSAGADVSDHTLPMAPSMTGHIGAQLTRSIAQRTNGYLRVEAQYTGQYYYDATNNEAQSGFTLVNLHLGATHGAWRAEIWSKNLFNQPYCPLAYPVPAGLTPSGYVAESGAPRTYGVSLSRKF